MYNLDSANFKQNKYSPGDKIKVIAPSEISNEKIDGIIIMAAGYSDEVYKFLKLKKFKGQNSDTQARSLNLSNITEI